jgi:hypothetical protein
MNQMEMVFDAVRKFLAKNKVKILIGTPCFGGMLHNGYFQSMLELSANFTRLGIPYEVITIGNESLIQRARNGIVAKFMSDDTATHLMFIDADITFSWISIVKLLLSNKEFSGGCYPKKCFNWDKIKHYNQKTPDLKEDELMAKSLDYVFNPIYHKQGENVVIRVENGMAQVKDIGTGFMMIHKSVIRKMMAKYPETKYKNNVAGYGQGNMDNCFYSLFDCCIDPVSRVYLSEDYLFCKRWIDIGGELWLDINTNLNHTGIIDYKGCLALTIGEVDTLNKDAQILRQQQEKLAKIQQIQQQLQQEKEKEKAKQTTAVAASVTSAASAASVPEPVVAPVAAPANTISKRQKKNKRRNKNKNNNVADAANGEDNAVDGNGDGDGEDLEDGDGDETGSDEETKTEVKEEKINDQAFNGTHC